MGADLARRNAAPSYERSKTTDLPQPIPNSPRTALVLPTKVDTDVPDVVEKSPPVPPKPPLPFKGRKRALEVGEIFTNTKTRTMLGKEIREHGGKDIWTLILETIDAGLLTANPRELDKPTIRVLFPDAPLAFTRAMTLDTVAGRRTVREEYLPALKRHRDEYLANPERVAEIIERDSAELRQRAASEAREKKLELERQKLAANEPEVVIYGRHFWPILHTEDPAQRYDYAQLIAAAWTFDEALRLARLGTDNSPRSCGMTIRHLIKRLAQYNDTLALGDPTRARWRMIFVLIGEMTRLLERAADIEDLGRRMPLAPLEKSYGD